jgi:hypothetical protein
VFVWLDSIPVRSQGNALHVWVCQSVISIPIIWVGCESIGLFQIHNADHWGRLRLRLGVVGSVEQNRGTGSGLTVVGGNRCAQTEDKRNAKR